MRILSLLPSATEIVYALGLQEQLVGVTHECDYPPEARAKPIVVESCLGSQPMGPSQIDARIRETVKRGESVYRFKPGALEQTKPEMILTQGICDVCAIPYQYVLGEIMKLKARPEILSLDPQDLTGVLTDIRRVGEATGTIDKAGEVVDALEERVGDVAGRTRDLPSSQRLRVAVLEWTDPLYAAGHWVPEMIELAGGQGVLAKHSEPSRVVSWEVLSAAAPELIIVAPCGYDVEKARTELPNLKTNKIWNDLPAARSNRIYLMDANATLSRPGPRIVNGLEDLAQIIHPEIFPVTAASARWAKV